MKLYKVKRNYGKIVIYEMCFAESRDDVYSVLDWEKKDKPTLDIEEVKEQRGCFLSLSSDL